MKFLFALLALTPLMHCDTMSEEEQMIIQSMTNEQKRALFNLHLPNWRNILHVLCVHLGSNTSIATCENMCPSLVSAIPFASVLCGPACKALQTVGKYC